MHPFGLLLTSVVPIQLRLLIHIVILYIHGYVHVSLSYQVITNTPIWATSDKCCGRQSVKVSNVLHSTSQSCSCGFITFQSQLAIDVVRKNKKST